MSQLSIETQAGPLGRADALVKLRSALARTSGTGRPGAVFVAGGAGAGKTRLTHEFAGCARRDAAQVWIGAHALPDGRPRWHSDRLGGRPTVVVLDDLHRADPVTCGLLGMLMHVVRRGRLLVVATYRPDELGPDHPVRRLLTELPQTMVNRMYLTGPDDPGRSDPEFGLTVRERQVLLEMAAGRTNRQIGRNLHISVHTVSIHVTRVLAKLGVSNRTAAAAAAHRLGMR